MIGEWSTNLPKEFLLPKGEGQDEGEPRSMTQRRIFFFQPRAESFQLSENAAHRPMNAMHSRQRVSVLECGG